MPITEDAGEACSEEEDEQSPQRDEDGCTQSPSRDGDLRLIERDPKADDQQCCQGGSGHDLPHVPIIGNGPYLHSGAQAQRCTRP